MKASQVRVKDFFRILRRRWLLLVVPPVVVTAVSTIAALNVKQMYESSILLLVQHNEIHNPLSTLMMQGEDDPLREAQEILLSTRTVDQLIDSLGLRSSVKTEVERRKLAGDIEKNIQIETKEGQSMAISYMDSDPHRAQHGVIALTNIFIDNNSSTTDEQNESMVNFYQAKLDQFREKLDESQADILPTMNESIKENASVTESINNIDQQIRDSQKNLETDQQELSMIEQFKRDDIETKDGRETLFEIQRADVPFVLDLRASISQYMDLSQRYTGKNPEVEQTADQIFDLLGRIKGAMQREIKRLDSQISTLKTQRSETVDEMVKLASIDHDEKDKEENYSLYQKLYTEMKVKLEEAQMNAAIAKNGDFKFEVLDPAYLPLFPSKPSRVMIVLGGLAAGIVIGIILVIVSELLDTTIRTPNQIALYQKPIIALLPQSQYKEEVL
jgi:uncharacterized protein involved in exopolysaccharide biosynthesis